MDEKIALSIGSRLKGNQEYTIVSVLGKGGYGITYQAQSTILVGSIPHTVDFAIKEFYMSSCCQRKSDGRVVMTSQAKQDVEMYKKEFRIEAEHLRDLNKYKGIVPVNEIFEANGTIYYVMQHLGNTSLARFIADRGGRLNEETAVRLAASIGRSLNVLHSKKMTHLDVKPENVMMVDEGSRWRPVLIDFGLSRRYNFLDKVTNNNVPLGVSEGYSPIEQYAGVEGFSPTADIYALGATLFFMLTGKRPERATLVNDEYLKTQLDGVASVKTQHALIHAMQKLAERRTPSIDIFLDELGVNAQPANAPLVPASSNEGNDTVVLSSGASGGSGQMGRRLLYVLVVLLLMAGTGFVTYKLMSSKSAAGTPGDTVTTARKGEVAGGETKDTTEQKGDEQKVVDTDESKGAKPQKKKETGQDVQKKSESDNNEVVVEKTSSGTLVLDYGVWNGPIKDGKPHGQGTLTYKSSHRVDSRDETETMAASGDVASGYFNGSHWVGGVTLKRENGERIQFAIGSD